ncbi:hypothetical protein MMC27_004381 [Xylographa pallens]|nr:hypothetical protein [Xylographa pallens]
MLQTRPATFLELPVHIREKIFMLCLTRECPVDILRERWRVQSEGDLNNSCWAEYEWCAECPYVGYRHRANELENKEASIRLRCYGPPVQTALLLVSRQVNEEASNVLFGQNKFIVRASRPDLLEDIFIPGSKALSKIRYLHVALENPDETIGLMFGYPRDGALIEAWEAMCNRLAPLISPWRLHFTFACAPADTDTAVYLADTLRLLPPVKHCALAFGSYLDHSFRPTVLELCLELSDMESPPADPFPFSSLPRELRLHVLAQTDLVVPSDSMRNSAAELHIVNGFLTSRRFCCTYCCAALQDCCCLTCPNAFSPTCRCALDPTGLLRLSREMHADTLEVFYSYNRFRFTGSLGQTLALLGRLSPTAVNLIRHVVLEFTWEEYNVWTENQREFMDAWKDLLKFIKDHFKLAVLNLTVHGNLWIYEEDEWSVNHPLDPEYYERIRAFYRDILGPVRILKGLKAYSVYLRDKEFWEMEEPAERAVMGREYNSARFCKISPEDREVP